MSKPCESQTRRCLIIATALLLLAIPARAGATAGRIAYLKTWWATQGSIWVANADGRSGRELVKTSYPWAIAFARISPNGKLVVYYLASVRPNGGARAMVVPVAGGKPRMLARNAAVLVWSPDSRLVVAVLRSGSNRLVTINVATGRMRTVASGPCIETPSFSPDSRSVVYASGPIPHRGVCHTDIYTVSVSGGKATRLTTDHHSDWPVWGPHWIALSRWRDPSGADESPTFQGLYLIRASGAGRRRLVATGSTAPRAIAWSADGKRLLASTGRGLAATVHPVTGDLRVVGRASGVAPVALSRDGRTILGTTNPRNTYNGTNVVMLPYRGGTQHTIIRQAAFPSWSL